MKTALACILSLLLTSCALDRSTGKGDVAALISAIFRVGPEGRALSLSNGAQITIPKGAMSKEVLLGFEAVEEATLPPLPDGLRAVSLFYAATPHGQTFEKPVEMGLPHSATDHLRAMALRLNDPQDQTWDPLNAGVSMQKAMALVSTDRFSFYVIAEPIAGATAPSTDCGNGQVDNGEVCDDGVNDGQSGGCMPGCQGMTAQCGDIPPGDAGVGSQAAMLVDGDGCCPPGASSLTDSDCGTTTCGNGVIEPQETCEPGVDDGCPSDCDDGDACTIDQLSGSADTCTATCAYETITATVDADGCCPANGDIENDTDCNPICGNGSVEGDEFCEPGAGDGCPTDCDDGDPCTTDRLVGSPDSCDAHCVHETTPTPDNGDGCCLPPVGNANNDSDCLPVCGNGEVETGERCDGDCPTPASCDDNNPCTRDSVAGTACDRQCVHEPITIATGGDLCCPENANANNDSDCSTSCGNGVVEGNETCDGNCPTSCDDGQVCTSDSLTGTPAQCNVRCTNIDITSPISGDLCCPDNANANNDSDCGPTCGNGVIEVSAETCEPNVGNGCATSCDDGNPCTTDTLLGSARTCDAICEHRVITEVGAVDGCCPIDPRANANSDLDCSPSCGNGALEAPTESCEPNVGNGCPSEDACFSQDSCVLASFTGDPARCTAVCTLTTITAAAPGDGCCPPGVSGRQDNDCLLLCGNGRLDSGEACDVGVMASPSPTAGPSPLPANASCTLPGEEKCDDGDICTEDLLTTGGETVTTPVPCGTVCTHRRLPNCPITPVTPTIPVVDIAVP